MASINTKAWVETTINNLLAVVKPKIVSLEQSVVSQVAVVDGKVQITKAGGEVLSSAVIPLTPIATAEVLSTGTSSKDAVSVKQFVDGQAAQDSLITAAQDKADANANKLYDLTKKTGTISALISKDNELEEAINDLTTAVSDNKTADDASIAALQTAVSDNKTAGEASLAELKAAYDNTVKHVATNISAIDDNKVAHDALKDEHNILFADYSHSQEHITDNKSKIAKNVTDIATNTEAIEANRIKGNANAAKNTQNASDIADLQAAASADKTAAETTAQAIDDKTVTGVSFANNELTLTQKDGSELKTGLDLDFRIKYVVDHFADLPAADANSNTWAIVRLDTDGSDDNGIYVSNGTTWEFALAVPNDLTLEGTQYTVTAFADLPDAAGNNGDYGTVITELATSYYKSIGGQWNLIKKQDLTDIIADDTEFGNGTATDRAVSVAQLASLFATSTSVEEMQVIYDAA